MQQPPPEPAVWEAHISHLMRHDPRWQRIWTTFVKHCSVPEDVESFPGHKTQEETPRGRQHMAAYDRCLKDPETFNDMMKEYASRVGKAFRMSPRRDEWRLARGKYTRHMAEVEDNIAEDLSLILGGQATNRTNFYYPRKGFRSWHTNSLDMVGWRVYLIHNIGNSSFRYRHPQTGVVQDCPDVDGTVRLFRVTVSSPLWHCVTSEGHRWSMGFHLTDYAAEVLRAHMRAVEPLPLPRCPTAGGVDACGSGERCTTPRAVALLFGSSSARRRHALESKAGPGEDGEDGEETKTGDPRPAWVRSGEYPAVGETELEEEDGSTFHDVRLTEVSTPTAAA